MKTKNRVTLVLLFIMTLYVSHGIFFANHHDEHEHHTHAYISEIEAPTSCGDVCDFHFVFHQVFLLPQTLIFYHDMQASIAPISKQKSYFFQPSLEFYKPPIS
jgi:hypothetical protein